jgi:quercetin dioxygenase-like cupin family protein
MSSLERLIAGDVLIHHLRRDGGSIDQDLLARHGRSARTLVKEGPLRVTVIALAAGGSLPAHHAEGPVTIQVLEGGVTFEAAGRQMLLATGDLLVLASGVQHGVRTDDGCMLLLTVVHLPSAGTPAGAT